MSKQTDDRMTAVYVSQKDLRIAVGLMESALGQLRDGCIARAGGSYPIWSDDAAALTELETVVRRFKRSVSEVNQ